MADAVGPLYSYGLLSSNETPLVPFEEYDWIALLKMLFCWTSLDLSFYSFACFICCSEGNSEGLTAEKGLSLKLFKSELY